MSLPHQPFWCEENIWHLAGDAAPGPGEREVLVISGAAGHVACWQQRAGRAGRPILWDYHVVLAVQGTMGWMVWDLDTRLGCPLPAISWLDGTFPHPERVPAEFQPRFAAIPAADYRARFGSDRAHMRRADGGWLKPPPAWPMITGTGLTLASLVRAAGAGCPLSEMQQRYVPSRRTRS